VIHFLSRSGDSWPGRKIVGVALAMIELQQPLIIRIHFARDFQALSKLH
jgi:hypothetical protein